jgi:predicted DNA-binding transcriptional regulator YafY
MNRTERLTAIIFLLQDKRRTSNDLARRFEVSKRTILRDVQALSEMGVPVVAEWGPGGGYSLLPEYSLSPLQLTLREALLLLLALSSVYKLPDTPFAQERESLLAKIRALIPRPQLRDADKLMELINVNVPQHAYETPFIEQLLHSAQDEGWVRVIYRSVRGSSQQLIQPQRLYAERGLWYCVAYSHERQEQRVYRVDRFVDVQPAQAPAQQKPSQPELPYDHPSHPEVVVKLTYRGVLEMERNPHFGAAIQRQADGSGLLRFRCPPHEFDWLTRYFSGLGLDAQVLAPDELGQRIKEAARQIVASYEKR